jgi:hypothetical protein
MRGVTDMPTIATRGIWGVEGYTIVEVEEYQARRAGGSYFYATVIGPTGIVYEHQLFGTVDIYIVAG